MLRGEIGESVIVLIWILFSFGLRVVGSIMRNSSDGQQQKNSTVARSFRAISSYLRIVSSGASTVARSAASVAQSIVDRDDDSNHDQVQWTGFDKLEGADDAIRQVLLLGYRSGFQVWDVEEADNVRDLVSRHDGPVSFLQMAPKPIASCRSDDKFADSRPLLVVCADGASSGNIQDGYATNGSISNQHDSVNTNFVPTVVRFYSLRYQSYVHMLKFRSAVYSVRCSSRVVAISQASQIHCCNAKTLEKEYTIITNPIVASYPGSWSMGYGPLAVGTRWLAYSGSPVAVSNSGRVSPQHLMPSASFPGFTSNGSMVAHYAKESSKQLAAGIVTLGDMGYKKLSRYCSELIPDSHGSLQSGTPSLKGNGTVNGYLPDAENIGMVVVKDIVSKSVIAQFRAHKSPISALCFDHSGTLLVTASVHGHNINVFKIMPALLGSTLADDTGASYAHLYRLQRGFTNAVIQDISFSSDSNWIMISSSKGTSHLFAINPLGGCVNVQFPDSNYTTKNNGFGGMTKPAVSVPHKSGFQTHNQQSLCASGPPVTLSVVSRIRNGNNGWRGTVTGAAAAATGRASSLNGAIASSFHNCKGNNDLYVDSASSKTKYHLLVFTPMGSMIQYALRLSAGMDSTTNVSGINTNYCDSGPENEGRLVVEAIQKWSICQKHSRREREDNFDIYGESGNSDSSKIYPEGRRKGNSIHPEGSSKPVKPNVSPEEKHHLYISEAELQMHQPSVPLWAKSEIYFQSMTIDEGKMDEGNSVRGEIEIEKIPAHTIEARSKDLVPVFDYFRTSKIRHARTPFVDINCNERLQCRRSGQSENGRITFRSSSGSLDSMTDASGAGVTELHNGIMTAESRGSVNNNDSPKTNTQLEIVNNREISKVEAQLKFVNNNTNGGSKMENHFEDEGDEFD